MVNGAQILHSKLGAILGPYCPKTLRRQPRKVKILCSDPDTIGPRRQCLRSYSAWPVTGPG
jgi:hypothetical protein